MYRSALRRPRPTPLRNLIRTAGVLALLGLLTACAGPAAVIHVPCGKANLGLCKQRSPESQSLVVFLDGTNNAADSYTNISKLYNLVTLQPDPHIRTAYIRGVGTDGFFCRSTSMATGMGIGEDVREAYRFLLDNYNPSRGDKIYIFGFSRGAYAGVILSSLLNSAGLPVAADGSQRDKEAFVERIYKAFKGEKPIGLRRAEIAKLIGGDPRPVGIEFVGLWDSVSALGVPDYTINYRPSVNRYGDQVCNIKRLVHVVSADDNRAQAFSPMLMTHNGLIEECDDRKSIEDTVTEVWFAGAHSDVGGSYRNTHIGGVSLNWMIKRVPEIIPRQTDVFANELDATNNGEQSISFAYKAVNRPLHHFAEETGYNGGKLKVHRSVLRRLAVRRPQSFEYDWAAGFPGCFEPSDDGLRYIASCGRLEVVD